MGLFSRNVAVLIAIYVAAVAAVGWYGGFGPSLLATALSYVIANWFFVPARDAFHPTATVFVYVFVCLVIGAFSEVSKPVYAPPAPMPSK